MVMRRDLLPYRGRVLQSSFKVFQESKGRHYEMLEICGCGIHHSLCIFDGKFPATKAKDYKNFRMGRDHDGTDARWIYKVHHLAVRTHNALLPRIHS